MELEPELEVPGLAEVRAKVESAIKDLLVLAYPELEGVDWMPVAWSAGVEAIGYNAEGRKFRAIETLNPEGQSLSATSGIADLSRDGYIAGQADYFDQEDED